MSDKTEGTIVKEFAEKELERFADIMGLDFDVADMDREDKADFESIKRRLIKRIMNRSLIINDNGEPVYTPQRSGEVEAITFKEPTGAMLMEMDKKKPSQEIGKVAIFMAAITGLSSAFFAKLKYADFNICSDITTLFMDAE